MRYRSSIQFKPRSPLTPCPPQGKGVHSWLYATACELRRRGELEEGIESYLYENATRKNPREIADAVANSCSESPRRTQRRQCRFRCSVPRFSLAELREASLQQLGNEGEGPAGVIGKLFPPYFLLCVGINRSTFRVGELDELAGILPRAEFIVPNSARSRTGTTLSGKQSSRCLEMFPRRDYIVIEFDPPKISDTAQQTELFDRQAAMLWFLAQRAPLAMVVHSGGKSLHGWFRAHDHEAVNLKFIDSAAMLGADPSAKTRCQPYRVPLGRRATGEIHHVYYFNPAATL